MFWGGGLNLSSVSGLTLLTSCFLSSQRTKQSRPGRHSSSVWKLNVGLVHQSADLEKVSTSDCSSCFSLGTSSRESTSQSSRDSNTSTHCCFLQESLYEETTFLLRPPTVCPSCHLCREPAPGAEEASQELPAGGGKRFLGRCLWWFYLRGELGSRTWRTFPAVLSSSFLVLSS